MKVDLEQFGIPCDFKHLISKSTEAFKRIVRIKAQEYALQILTLKQQKHSKMDNIMYIGMQPQNYTSMENIKSRAGENSVSQENQNG